MTSLAARKFRADAIRSGVLQPIPARAVSAARSEGVEEWQGERSSHDRIWTVHTPPPLAASTVFRTGIRRPVYFEFAAQAEG